MATRSSRTDWLALGPASRLIGVDPDTLRRWADEGRIAAWATPGGHRRFARSDLDRLIAARRVGPDGPLAALGATEARVSAAYRRGYARAARQRDPSRYGDADDRDAFRADGRRLVAVLLEHLDAPDSLSRASTEAVAAEVATELGRRLATAGVPLDVAVTEFVTARRPFLAEIAGLSRRRSLPADRLADVYERATAVLDRLLLRFVAAHAAVRRTTPRSPTAPRS